MFPRILSQSVRLVHGHQRAICLPVGRLFSTTSVTGFQKNEAEVEALKKTTAVNEEALFRPPPDMEFQQKLVDSIDEYRPKESLEDAMRVRFGEEMPTINDEKSPQRDIVNFPRDPTKKYADKTRFLFIPDEWFTMFYNKTGVTGPYVLGGGLITFLLSKEWFVIEHESVAGLSLFIILGTMAKMYGPKLSAFLEKHHETEMDRWDHYQNHSIECLNTIIDHEKKNSSGRADKMLFDAKRENVQLQMEAEFRRRQMVVFQEVKKKLDFQVAIQTSKKQFEQKHMVQWIIDSVVKSITPQHEKDALTKCIGDLKQLAAKRKIDPLA